MSLTYVTAMLKIYDIEYNEKRNGKNLTDRLRHFQSLVETGVQLVVYVSAIYKDDVERVCKGFPVKIVVVELSDTWTYKEVVKWKETIPVHRNEAKDTFEFLTLMMAKAEFLHRTVESNPFGSEQFAWADFNVFHVLFNGFTSQEVLRGLCDVKLKEEHSFVVPGCWEKGRGLDRNNIHWRFCGGFFMGTAQGIRTFFDLHKQHLATAFDGMTWEVNFWAWLEREGNWKPTWYKAGHDASLITVPAEFFETVPATVQWLTKAEGAKSGTYTYPFLENAHATSSSFLNNTLCVRYVNYILTPPGLYIIHDAQGHLRTWNMLFELSEDRRSLIESGRQMNLVTAMPISGMAIQGIEDVRLYEFEGMMKCIGTQRQWSPTQQNRMMICDVSGSSFENAVVVEPPVPTGCEKNWIPVVHEGREHFIYQWFPFQVGVLENGQLRITIEHEMPNLFGKVRGSTVFLEEGSTLIGLVHYSEDRSPRHYYHMLVELDKATLRPLRRSRPFVFGRIGVEFCIGMAKEG